VRLLDEFFCRSDNGSHISRASAPAEKRAESRIEGCNVLEEVGLSTILTPLNAIFHGIDEIHPFGFRNFKGIIAEHSKVRNAEVKIRRPVRF
jgi:hypothetical protein